MCVLEDKEEEGGDVINLGLNKSVKQRLNLSGS